MVVSAAQNDTLLYSRIEIIEVQGSCYTSPQIFKMMVYQRQYLEPERSLIVLVGHLSETITSLLLVGRKMSLGLLTASVRSQQ